MIFLRATCKPWLLVVVLAQALVCSAYAQNAPQTPPENLPEICHKYLALSTQLAQWRRAHERPTAARNVGFGAMTAGFGSILARYVREMPVLLGEAVAPRMTARFLVPRILMGTVGLGIVVAEMFIDTAPYRDPHDPENRLVDLAWNHFPNPHRPDYLSELTLGCNTIVADVHLQDAVNAWWNEVHRTEPARQ